MGIFSKRADVTDEWALYEKGRQYNEKLGLYSIVGENQRYYAGDQWRGVESNGLPTPVFNIFKRVVNYFVAAILSQSVAVKFCPDEVAQSEIASAAADIINRHVAFRWEKLKMNSLMADALLDAALSGDAVAFTYWDGGIKTGQLYTGDFVTELVDNVNVFFGNPECKSVQKQPYILIAGRDLAVNLQQEAKRRGKSESEIKLIVPDKDDAGDCGDDKCTYLIKLWRGGDGKVRQRKSVKAVTIYDEQDTGLRLYPVAYMNWDKRKDTWHGQAVATGLIPNQRYINKAFALVMYYMMTSAFGKVAYDATLIDSWDGGIGRPIPVNGSPAGAVQVVGTGQINPVMLDTISMAVSMTKELMGVTDAALGNVKPENTSAILALQQASAVPLENVRRQFYQFIEDIALVWLDFMLSYYDDGRALALGEQGGYGTVPFSKLGDVLFSCKVEVGQSSYWSEIAAAQTLDGLLKAGLISLEQYLERIPDSLIPKKQALLEQVKASAQSAFSAI